MSLVRKVDRSIFNYGLSRCYRIARANLYVRSSYFLKQVPLSWIRSIDVEPIARCNLECPFCQVPGWHRATETEPMGMELFGKILDQFPNLKHIKLQGMGEPFLNQDLTKMIRMATERKLRTTIITNGTLLDHSLALDVLESGLTNLCFSFDGATKATYESLRVGADFDKVVSNIRTVCGLKKAGHHPTNIRMNALVSTQAVLDELPDLVELAAEIGVETVFVAERCKVWKRDQRKTIPVTCLPISGFIGSAAALSCAEQKAKNLNVVLRVGQLQKHRAPYPCAAPWSSLYVSVEGRIVPCSHIASPDTWCLGSLAEDNVQSVWNGRQFSGLRRSILRNEPTRYCAGCYGKSGE